jgi:hypothetical protein
MPWFDLGDAGIPFTHSARAHFFNATPGSVSCINFWLKNMILTPSFNNSVVRYSRSIVYTITLSPQQLWVRSTATKNVGYWHMMSTCFRHKKNDLGQL